MRYLDVDTAKKISKIGLGTAQSGPKDCGYGEPYAYHEAHSIVRRVAGARVTLCDTAIWLMIQITMEFAWEAPQINATRLKLSMDSPTILSAEKSKTALARCNDSNRMRLHEQGPAA